MDVYGYDRDEFGMRADQYLFRVAACTAEGYAATDPPKRPQRGGVPKGRIWTLVAAEQVHWGLQFNNQAGREARHRWLGLALNTIYQHSRTPETRAEALRLLTVLETRG